MKKRILTMLLALTMGFTLTACEEAPTTTTSGDDEVAPRGEADESEKVILEGKGNSQEVKLENGDTYAVMSIKNFGDITLKLFPDCAPIAVQNFIDLAESGYYEGKIFHRIIAGFMIQGGSPYGDGMSDPDFETFGVEAHENATHLYGALSMANARGRNAQQFFIINNPNGVSYLDGGYSVFGHMVDGFEVLEAVSAVDVDYNDGGEFSSPIEEVIIESVAIHAFISE